MRIRRKHLMWTGVVAAGLAIAALMLRPGAIEVEWAVAARGPLRIFTEAESRTRSRSRYVITAPVGGLVERLRLAPGDSVRAGSLVARIAAMPLDQLTQASARTRVAAARAAQREAESRLSQARLAAEIALKDRDRARALETAGGVSTQERESAEALANARSEDLRVAELGVVAAEHEVRAADAVLNSSTSDAPATIVRSPVRGRVLRVPEISERVTAAGTPLLELSDASDLEIVADFLSTEAVRIRPGAKAELEGWGGDSILRARVRLVEPVATTRVSALGVDEQRVSVILDPLDAAPALGDGYRLTARVVLWEGQNVLCVPSSAVFKEGDEWRLFVVERGRAQTRSIVIGRRSDATVEVRSGVAVSDTVLLFPSDRVKDGARLRLR